MARSLRLAPLAVVLLVAGCPLAAGVKGTAPTPGPKASAAPSPTPAASPSPSPTPAGTGSVRVGALDLADVHVISEQIVLPSTYQIQAMIAPLVALPCTAATAAIASAFYDPAGDGQANDYGGPEAATQSGSVLLWPVSPQALAASLSASIGGTLARTITASATDSYAEGWYQGAEDALVTMSFPLSVQGTISLSIQGSGAYLGAFTDDPLSYQPLSGLPMGDVRLLSATDVAPQGTSHEATASILVSVTDPAGATVNGLTASDFYAFPVEQSLSDKVDLGDIVDWAPQLLAGGQDAGFTAASAAQNADGSYSLVVPLKISGMPASGSVIVGVQTPGLSEVIQ